MFAQLEVPNKDPLKLFKTARPLTVNVPKTAVEPVILILLPDILVASQTKFPSPSTNVNVEPFTVISFPALGREVVRSISPIEIYVYYI